MSLTVILPVYLKDNPFYLDLALESIWVKQIYKPDEIILIQDGPLTTDLLAVIDRWHLEIGSVFNKLVLDENHGLAFALNRGIEVSRSKYIARMDSDDISLPCRFHIQMTFLYDHPEVDVLGSWAQDIDENGCELSLRKVPVYNREILKYIWTCPLIHPTVVFKKSSIQRVGLYSEKLKRRQDYELWFRCAQASLNFYNIPTPLLLYRYTDEWFVKNNFHVIWKQVLIGWKGSFMLGAGPLAYVGTAFPLVKLLLPKKIGLYFTDYFRKIDPRANKSGT